MKRTYRYRLYPTRRQADALHDQAREAMNLTIGWLDSLTVRSNNRQIPEHARRYADKLRAALGEGGPDA